MDAEHPAPSPTHGPPIPDPTPVERYEICVGSRLDPRWSSWLDGLTVLSRPDGTSVITGPVPDQAALHGLLQKLRDLGVTLLSLTRIGPAGGPGPSDAPTDPVDPNQPGAPS